MSTKAVKAIRARIMNDVTIMNKVAMVEANIIPTAAKFPAIYIALSDMAIIHCYNGWLMRGSVEIGVYADKYAIAEDVKERLRELFDRHQEIFEGIKLTFNSGEEESDSFDDEVNKHVKAITFPLVLSK